MTVVELHLQDEARRSDTSSAWKAFLVTGIPPVAASTKDKASNAANPCHFMQAAPRALQTSPGGAVLCRAGVEESVIMVTLIW